MQGGQTKHKIVVLGGAVMDFFFVVDSLPPWGESVQTPTFLALPGGKGLNQAIAAAKMGAEVTLVSAIGNDEFGRHVQETLHDHHVSDEFVEVSPEGGTAVTAVFVNHRAEHSFIGWKSVISSKVGAGLVKRAKDRIKEAEAILITLEVSLEAVAEAISIASKNKVKIFLHPAPPLEPLEVFPHNLLQDVYAITPNSWEARQLLRSETDDLKDLALSLHKMGAEVTCITTPELSCVVATNGQVKEYPSLAFAQPVDRTGGSDAFCATLALSVLEEIRLDEAIKRACMAGVLAFRVLGGSIAMPDRKEIDRFLQKEGITERRQKA